jgi:LPS-assembly lipoprotein
MKRLTFAPVIAALLFCLSACGEPFHLRGSAGSMPEIAQAMTVQGVDMQSDFGQALSEGLQNARVTLQENAPTLLTITGVTENRIVSGYSANRQVREFNHILDVAFRISGGTVGEAKPQSVHVERSQIYDSNYVLGTSSEEDQIKQELRREAVRLMILKLRAALAPAAKQP